MGFEVRGLVSMSRVDIGDGASPHTAIEMVESLDALHLEAYWLNMLAYNLVNGCEDVVPQSNPFFFMRDDSV